MKITGPLSAPKAVGLLLAAAAGILGSMAPATAQATELRDPGCTFETTSTPVDRATIGGTQFGLKVKLVANGCRSTIRAYVHCNGFPYGTYYRIGGQISSAGSTTTAWCDAGDPFYGWSGYEIRSGNTWHRVPTYHR